MSAAPDGEPASAGDRVLHDRSDLRRVIRYVYGVRGRGPPGVQTHDQVRVLLIGGAYSRRGRDRRGGVGVCRTAGQQGPRESRAAHTCRGPGE